MGIGSTSLEAFLKKFYGSMVQKEFGARGVSVHEDLIEGIHSIYKFIEPSACDFPITVFKTLDENSQPIQSPQTYIINEYEQLVQIIDQECIIRLTTNGQIHVWKYHTIDLSILTKLAVVYKYVDRLEYFYANSAFEMFPKAISSPQASTFTNDTFDDLLEALEYYRCHTECCVGMCPIGKRLLLTLYAHRISSPLGYAMSMLFVFTSLLSAHILKKTQTSPSAGASFQRRSFRQWRRTPWTVGTWLGAIRVTMSRALMRRSPTTPRTAPI